MTFSKFLSIYFFIVFFLAQECQSAVSNLLCRGRQRPLSSVILTASSEFDDNHGVDQICLRNLPSGDKAGEFTQSWYNNEQRPYMGVGARGLGEGGYSSPPPLFKVGGLYIRHTTYV